jgi:CheY-like chemotaxis protein
MTEASRVAESIGSSTADNMAAAVKHPANTHAPELVIEQTTRDLMRRGWVISQVINAWTTRRRAAFELWRLNARQLDAQTPQRPSDCALERCASEAPPQRGISVTIAEEGRRHTYANDGGLLSDDLSVATPTGAFSQHTSRRSSRIGRFGGTAARAARTSTRASSTLDGRSGAPRDEAGGGGPIIPLEDSLTLAAEASGYGRVEPGVDHDKGALELSATNDMNEVMRALGREAKEKRHLRVKSWNSDGHCVDPSRPASPAHHIPRPPSTSMSNIAQSNSRRAAAVSSSAVIRGLRGGRQKSAGGARTPTPAAASSSSSPSTPPPRVLIVDDDIASVGLMTRMLKREIDAGKVIVDHAKTTTKALTLICLNGLSSYVAVYTNQVIPQMSGWTFVAHLTAPPCEDLEMAWTSGGATCDGGGAARERVDGYGFSTDQFSLAELHMRGPIGSIYESGTDELRDARSTL